MTKEQYLEKHIYYGLTNLNTGWDAPSIFYFTTDEFKIILKRVETIGIGIYGLEPYLDNEYFDTKVFEEYSLESTDSNWYNKAFLEFVSLGKNLQYAASYYVPNEFLI